MTQTISSDLRYPTTAEGRIQDFQTVCGIRRIKGYLTGSLKRFTDSDTEGSAVLTPTIINTEVYWVSFSQPESQATTTTWQHITDRYVSELFSHSTNAAKRNDTEPSKESFPGNREPVFVL